MATLYGNEAAIQSAHSRTPALGTITYKPGSVLALVTWAQREDPHWFGARIPSTLFSVEFVEIPSSDTPIYQAVSCSGLAIRLGPEEKRTVFMLALTPTRLP